jgi:ATP-dependent HslUV protease ATP-binding subunit HslU
MKLISQKTLTKKVKNTTSEHSNSTSIPAAFVIYEKLGEFVIGQEEAKKALALAFVNNLRRVALRAINKDLAKSISPKNVLLIGDTGSGKTELGRTLAKLADAPFAKVEATKFTEVGYAGKDVESIIGDLFHNAIKEERRIKAEENKEKVQQEAYIKVAKMIIKQHPDLYKDTEVAIIVEKIKDGQCKDLEIEIDNITEKIFEIFESGVAEMGHGAFAAIPIIGSIDFAGSSKKKKKVSVVEALEVAEKKELQKRINEEEIINSAREKVETKGIIFLDEIDKIITDKDSHGRGEVSREGVQRDLLPLVDGTIVQTSFGPINTENMLFIGSGAFSRAKETDFMSEFQGRFPIKAHLKSLTAVDYYKILTEKKFNLVEQSKGLLSSSEIDLEFTDEGIMEIAISAEQLNINLGNLGARRLFSVTEAILQEISFDKVGKKHYTIDKNFVKGIFKKLNKNEIDFAKFVI